MMNLQQLLQWRTGSGKSAGSPEVDRCHSGRKKGLSVAAGSDWSLHLTEEGLLEQRVSVKQFKKCFSLSLNNVY